MENWFESAPGEPDRSGEVINIDRFAGVRRDVVTNLVSDEPSIKALRNVWANHGPRETHWARQAGASKGPAKYWAS